MKTTNQSKVELLDTLGTDLTIVNAARVSFEKESTELDSKDEKLIQYLAKHGHWTPFAHTQAQFRISAPIFVARQLVKHQIGLVWNEVSRRYVKSDPEFYFPKVWRGTAENIKQGSAGVVDSNQPNIQINAATTMLVGHSLDVYNSLLEAGVCPEQARMVLPQNAMTTWWWTGSLVAFARVCKQRLDPHAQAETREVAAQIQTLLEPRFPISWRALNEL